MKARLTFDLSDPDDRREHELAIMAEKMASALWGIGTLNSTLKYREDIDWDTWDIIRGEIAQIFDEHNIIWEKLG
jgi:hypothetical protein